MHRYKPFNDRYNVPLHRTTEHQQPGSFNSHNRLLYNESSPLYTSRYTRPQSALSTPPIRFAQMPFPLTESSHQLPILNVIHQESKLFLKNENIAINSEDWFYQWVETALKLKPSTKEKEIKVLQESILKIVNLLVKLESLDVELKTKETMIVKTELLQNEIISLKKQISNLLQMLHADQYKEDVKKFLRDRREKRNGIKAKRERMKQRKITKLNKLNDKSRVIDEWRRLLIKEKQEEQQEEKLKYDADKVLCEVHKKQEQAQKMIFLLQKLHELRNTRTKSSLAIGIPVSQERSQLFNQIRENVKETIEAHLVNYHLEEKTLRVMMEKTPSKTVIPKNERIPSQLKVQEEIRQILFGQCSKSRGSSDEMKPAEESLNDLVKIRREWDTFLNNSDFASAIPIGWVVPLEKSSPEWEEYLFTQ